MKRISHISLFLALAAMVYINLGDLARIGMELADAKIEGAKSAMAGGNHTTLSVSAKEIANGEVVFIGNTEVRYHGRLYDIASSKQTGTTLYLTVAADEKEEGLLSELSQHVEQWFNSPAKPDKKPTVKHTDLLKDFILSNKIQFTYTSTSISFHASITAPPAETVMTVEGTPPRLG